MENVFWMLGVEWVKDLDVKKFNYCTKCNFSFTNMLSLLNPAHFLVAFEKESIWMSWKLNEAKKFRKTFQDVLERGVGVEIKSHCILP